MVGVRVCERLGRGRIGRSLLVAAWCVTHIACGRESPEAEPVTAQAQHSAQGIVVARVNGGAITLAEVEELSRATDLTPMEALVRLEEERVLADYAEAKGYGQGAHAARELKRARVRAMLKTGVEQGTAAEDVAAGEVSTRFEAIKQRDEKPEQRVVTHVLFKTGEAGREAKARAEAELLLREVSAHERLDAQRAALDALPEKGEHHGVPVVREALRAHKDALEAPFAEAAFALSKPGLVSRVARTSRGFHVILVQTIEPPVRLVLAEHEAAIRAQLSIEKRQAALAKLLDELKQKDIPELDEAFVRRALADERLLGAAP